jgi:D-cysteine desulfhydrase family pyridoxal phosphate-dependent enzyme
MVKPLQLAVTPTPVDRLDRLSEQLGGPQLYVKRDDLTGLGLGGNKARKLEYLCAEALSANCDVLVTGGGPQSNHARMTAAAAARLGLDCKLLLTGERPARMTGNLLIDVLFGATVEFHGSATYAELERAVEEAAQALRAEGRRPYAIPLGGSSVTGATAYVAAADELRSQVSDITAVVVADGSGGTHAGLLAGFESEIAVVGVDVGTRPDIDEAVASLARETAASIGRNAGNVEIDHRWIGNGYGIPTNESVGALRLVARIEGLILDPVYTSKAMAGLMGAIRENRFSASDSVVFLHTGGSPALFADRYGHSLLEP